eukprot:998784-Amorphochlora_amoeboformis.AAC.1
MHKYLLSTSRSISGQDASMVALYCDLGNLLDDLLKDQEKEQIDIMEVYSGLASVQGRVEARESGDVCDGVRIK